MPGRPTGGGRPGQTDNLKGECRSVMENSTQGLDEPATNASRSLPYRMRPYRESAVVAALNGYPGLLTAASRCEAIRRLTEQGVGAKKIAEKLQCTESTVRRARRLIRATRAA